MSRFTDDFERPDQTGLGMTPDNHLWMLSGAGANDIQIVSGRYVQGLTPAGNGYAAILLTQQPVSIGGTISWVDNPGGTGDSVFALISSADDTITLQHMLHLIITPSFAGLTWWLGASQNQPMATGPNGFTMNPPCATDGTVYPLKMTINGDNVHVDLPNGQSVDWSDPHVSQVAGHLCIYELAYSSTNQNIPRWEGTFGG